MRRVDKEITSRAEIDSIIRACQVCRLAFAVGGEPYVVPVCFGYDGERLYFHTARSGKKIDFIQANNRVCFEFERNVKLHRHAGDACKWTFSFESVIGYGTVSELTGPAEKAQGMNHIMVQYSGSEWSFDADALARTRIWSVSVQSVTGKRSKEPATS